MKTKFEKVYGVVLDILVAGFLLSMILSVLLLTKQMALQNDRYELENNTEIKTKVFTNTMQEAYNFCVDQYKLKSYDSNLSVSFYTNDRQVVGVLQISCKNILEGYKPKVKGLMGSMNENK